MNIGRRYQGLTYAEGKQKNELWRSQEGGGDMVLTGACSGGVYFGVNMIVSVQRVYTSE